MSSSCPSLKAVEVLWLFGQEQGKNTAAGKKENKCFATLLFTTNSVFVYLHTLSHTERFSPYFFGASALPLCVTGCPAARLPGWLAGRERANCSLVTLRLPRSRCALMPCENEGLTAARTSRQPPHRNELASCRLQLPLPLPLPHHICYTLWSVVKRRKCIYFLCPVRT